MVARQISVVQESALSKDELTILRTIANRIGQYDLNDLVKSLPTIKEKIIKTCVESLIEANYIFVIAVTSPTTKRVYCLTNNGKKMV